MYKPIKETKWNNFKKILNLKNAEKYIQKNRKNKTTSNMIDLVKP